MWHNIFDQTWPALVGAGVAGIIVGLTKRRPLSWILLMVLMFALVAVCTQTTWALFPQLRHGWIRIAVIVGVAGVISVPIAFLMTKFCQKK